METLIPQAEYSIPGQLAFFPEYEDKKKRNSHEPVFARPIPPPDMAFEEDWQVNILMADVLRRFGGMLPERWLYGIMVDSGFVSYFVYADALGSLLDNASAARVTNAEGEESIVLTTTGTENVLRLRHMVPKIFRDRVHLSAVRYINRQRALQEMQITYEPAEEGCMLCIRCVEKGTEMLTLRLHAPSREAAEELAERILLNASGFFGKILDLALRNEEIPVDLSDN